MVISGAESKGIGGRAVSSFVKLAVPTVVGRVSQQCDIWRIRR
jgi:hypothetical protein